MRVIVTFDDGKEEVFIISKIVFTGRPPYHMRWSRTAVIYGETGQVDYYRNADSIREIRSIDANVSLQSKK
jgi:hypothetical protein